LGGLSLAAAVVAAAAGVAYSYFTATGTGSGLGSVGSLTLTVEYPATRSCPYTSLSPGDTEACTFSVTYSGGISAYVSLTVAVESKAGPGGSNLYDPTGGGLALSISDDHNNIFTVPAGAGTTVGCASGYTCWTSAYDLAASYDDSIPSLTFTDGQTATWKITPQFPASATNSYQGGTATVTLTAQAVQAPGNSLPSGCNTSSIGKPCPPTSSFSWS
jgi:hypothetical protein